MDRSEQEALGRTAIKMKYCTGAKQLYIAEEFYKNQILLLLNLINKFQ